MDRPHQRLACHVPQARTRLWQEHQCAVRAPPGRISQARVPRGVLSVLLATAAAQGRLLIHPVQRVRMLLRVSRPARRVPPDIVAAWVRLPTRHALQVHILLKAKDSVSHAQLVAAAR